VTALLLRRAQGHRSGDGGPDDYDVTDGDRDVGASIASTRPTNSGGGASTSCSRTARATPPREEAMAAFRAEHEKWQREQAK
jgi:hypothetical protein